MKGFFISTGFFFALIICGCARNSVLDFSAAVAAPRNVQASDATYINKVVITWNAADSAVSYKVQRSAKASSGYVTIGTTNKTSYEDTTAFADVTYYYAVQTVGAGSVSGLSTIDAGGTNVDTRTFTAGIFAGTCGATGTANGAFNNPAGITNDGTYLYVQEIGNKRVQRLFLSTGISGGSVSSTATWATQVGGGACHSGTVGNPISPFCFDIGYGNSLVYSNGYLFVNDTNANRRLVRFSPGGSGSTTATFAGQLGGGVDAWNMTSALPATGIAERYYDGIFNFHLSTTSEGYLVVADSVKTRVSIIDQSGALIRAFGATGTDDYAFGVGGSAGIPAGPASLVVDSANNLYIADPPNIRISKYSINGELIGHRYSIDNITGWNKGLTSTAGTGNGRFPDANFQNQGIRSIAIDSKGYLYVANHVNGSLADIQQFSPNGRFLQRFGSGILSTTDATGVRGMVFDPNDNILYVAENHCVRKFTR